MKVFFFIVVFHNPAEKERMGDEQGQGTKTEIKTSAVRGSQGSAGAHEGWASDKSPMA